jgi:hypothetical protein
VGGRVHDRLRDLELRALKHPPNPLRSEADAFGFLLWFVGAVVVILLVVLLIQSL